MIAKIEQLLKDNAGITAGVIVILLCVLYLTYCAFAVRERKSGEQTAL